MTAELIDTELFKTFVPPGKLRAANFKELASKAFVEELAAGATIFKQGDVDKKTVYLIDGEVTLMTGKDEARTVKSGTEVAKHPLGNFQPRRHDAVAKVASKITRLDNDLMDILVSWDQTSGIDVDDLQDEEDNTDQDWMTKVLQSKAFLQVPPSSIQTIFMRIQAIHVKAGDSIIKQGDTGDYYYLIERGKCKVSRTRESGAELTLARLKEGDTFGEEALLSDAKRNANVTMETDGTLMRLSKQDFNELLQTPVLHYLTRKEADEMVSQGAIWVDVRLDSEYKHDGIPGSINLPLLTLRLKMKTLDADKKYVAYCDSGQRGRTAAFLLSQYGLQAFCLKGGLRGSDSDQAK